MSYKNFLSVLVLAALFSGTAAAQVGWWSVDHQIVEVTSVERLTDIYPGIRGISDELITRPWYITHYKEAIYFNADDGEHGPELWRYDGTNASLVEEFVPGEIGGHPLWFVNYQGDLYFNAGRNDVGRELFRFDGNSVELAANIPPLTASGNPRGMIVVNDLLYFVAETPEHGDELWKFDGTTATRVTDLNPGPESGVQNCCSRFGDEVIFSGQRNSGEGWEPWAFDGTTPRLLGDINPNGDSNYNTLGAAVFQDTLYFRADDGVHGNELWRYDGETVAMVEDLAPDQLGSNPFWLTVFDNKLYFTADGLLGGTLHRYDGTSIELAAAGPASPKNLRVFDNRLFFSGGQGQEYRDRELWSFDGTTPSLVKNINQENDPVGQPYSSTPKGFTPSGDGLVITVVGGNPSDATSTPLGHSLYFMANDGVHGFELWRIGRRQRMEIDVVAAEIFDKFWEWPINRDEALNLEVVAATFLFEGNERRIVQLQQFSIESLLRDPEKLRSSVNVTDESRSIAVTSVFFHAETGETLGTGFNVIRSIDQEDMDLLQRRADEFGKNLTLNQILSMRDPNVEQQ